MIVFFSTTKPHGPADERGRSRILPAGNIHDISMAEALIRAARAATQTIFASSWPNAAQKR